MKINREGKIKLFLSFALLGYSFLVSVITKNFLAFLAMFFSTSGDIYIMASRGVFCEQKKNSFKLGVVAFAFAHIIYIMAMQNEHSIAFVTISMTALFMVICLTVLKDNNSNFIPYAICIIVNAINAFLFSWIAVAGMVLFLTSDAILSICEKKSSKWQIAIWATYVPAQVLILTSILLA